jgi:nicotinamide mononucleotide adenylyltransferase
MHLRLMEDARDAINAAGRYEVIAGFLSPTHDRYGKSTLAPAHHRINMCVRVCVCACARALAAHTSPCRPFRAMLAVHDSDWLDVDMWECAQEEWTPTAEALDRFAREMSSVLVKIGSAEPQHVAAKVQPAVLGPTRCAAGRSGVAATVAAFLPR